MTTELDKIDRKILSLIQRDASLSASEIAEQVNLSQPPCWRRIRRLEKEGYIDRRVGILNKKKLGYNVVTYAEVKLTANGRQDVKAFEEGVKAFPEVTECYLMMGQFDFLLRIITKDIEAYENFYREKLSLLPGIQDMASSVALAEVKHTTEVPLDSI